MGLPPTRRPRQSQNLLLCRPRPAAAGKGTLLRSSHLHQPRHPLQRPAAVPAGTAVRPKKRRPQPPTGRLRRRNRSPAAAGRNPRHPGPRRRPGRRPLAAGCRRKAGRPPPPAGTLQNPLQLPQTPRTSRPGPGHARNLHPLPRQHTSRNKPLQRPAGSLPQRRSPAARQPQPAARAGKKRPADPATENHPPAAHPLLPRHQQPHPLHQPHRSPQPPKAQRAAGRNRPPQNRGQAGAHHRPDRLRARPQPAGALPRPQTQRDRLESPQHPARRPVGLQPQHSRKSLPERRRHRLLPQAHVRILRGEGYQV